MVTRVSLTIHKTMTHIIFGNFLYLLSIYMENNTTTWKTTTDERLEEYCKSDERLWWKSVICP